MKKENNWERFEPMARNNLGQYMGWIVPTWILWGIYFTIRVTWVNLDSVETGQKLITAFDNVAGGLAIAAGLFATVFLWLAPIIVREIYRAEWYKVTGALWVDCEENPWVIHDQSLALLAIMVHNHEGDAAEAKELKAKFWHARQLASALESAHPWSGKLRKIGDISHYVDVYRKQHRAERDEG